MEEYPMSCYYFWRPIYCKVWVLGCIKPIDFIFKRCQRNSFSGIAISPAKIAFLSKRSHMYIAFTFSITLVFLCNSGAVFLSSIFSAFQQWLKKLPKEGFYCSPLWLLFFAEHWQRVISATPLPSFKETLLVLHFLPKNRQSRYYAVNFLLLLLFWSALYIKNWVLS